VSSSWQQVVISDVAELVRGVTYAKEDSRDTPAKGFSPVLRATNIQDSRLVLESDLVYVPSDNVSPTQRLRAGDIVMATSSGSKHLVGKSALMRTDWVGSFGAFCAALRAKPNIDPRYLSAFLQSPAYWKQVTKKALGVNINNLRRGDIETLALPLPELDEQREIVAELEKQFSRLDEAVANLKRVKANLKRYKASVLKDAVEGRLVPTEVELARREGRSFETGEQLLQRILEARRSQWKGKGKFKEPSGLSAAHLAEVPEGWATTTAGQLCDCIVPSRDKPKSFSGTTPWLTLPDFEEDEIVISGSRVGLGLSESEVAESKAKVVPQGSVVMSCVGRFGITAVLGEDAVINQQLHAFLPSSMVMPKYMAYALRTRVQEMSAASTATTIAYLNKENCNNVQIACPPLPEQIRIVAEVDRRLSFVFEVEEQVDSNLKRAHALRQATLSAMFSRTQQH
jgi:type I restriction enzyme S subunit